MEDSDQKEDIVGVLQRSVGSESETGICLLCIHFSVPFHHYLQYKPMCLEMLLYTVLHCLFLAKH